MLDLNFIVCYTSSKQESVSKVLPWKADLTTNFRFSEYNFDFLPPILVRSITNHLWMHLTNSRMLLQWHFITASALFQDIGTPGQRHLGHVAMAQALDLGNLLLFEPPLYTSLSFCWRFTLKTIVDGLVLLGIETRIILLNEWVEQAMAQQGPTRVLSS